MRPLRISSFSLTSKMSAKTERPPDCDGSAVQFVRVPTTRAIRRIFLLRGAPNQRSYPSSTRRQAMEVYEAVRTVLAVRSYQEKAVPPNVIRRIVEAGWLTGSAMNSQPWSFIVVEDRDALRRLGALARTGPYVAQAPLAIVVAIERTKFSVSDASRTIQSMILTAWSEGVGSNWVGFMNLDDVKPLLGIPENLDLLAIVPFGYPARAVGKGQKRRKPLSEVAHRGRFGRPFE